MPKNTSKGYDDFLAAGGKDEWLDDWMNNVNISGGPLSTGPSRLPMRGEIVHILKDEVRHVMDLIYALVLSRGNYRYFNNHADAAGARMLRNFRDPSKTITRVGALFSG
jgi:hypothetical protein